MSIVDKKIIDYWRKDVNMRLMVERRCAKQNKISIDRLEGLKEVLSFYLDTHKDLINKELVEDKNFREYEHFSNI